MVLKSISLRCLAAFFVSSSAASIDTHSAFPVCNVRSYGAQGENRTEDTQAIQEAINACRRGGSLVFPAPGAYLTRSLDISGAVNLEIVIEPHATVIAWGHPSTWSTTGANHMLFNADAQQEVRNLTLHGGGTIDGQGWRWWGLPTGHFRPSLLWLPNVTTLLLTNITLKDTPIWNTHLRGSNMHVHDVTVVANAGECVDNVQQAPNTDGFNIAGHDIYIHDCLVHNGDDCIPVLALEGEGTYNVLVERVHCECGTNGGVIILGDDTCGGSHATIRNVTFRDMTVNGTNQAAGMKLCGGGQKSHALAQDVTWESLVVSHPRKAALYIDVFAEGFLPSCSPPSDPNLPQWLTGQGLTFRNVSGVLSAGTPAGCFLCTPGTPCSASFDHVELAKDGGGPATPYTCFHLNASSNSGGNSPPVCT